MSNDVLVPSWIFFTLAAISTLWLLQHLLLPSARWFFRRRANRLIDEVNNKLALRIPSFKLTNREVLIDRLMYDKRVIAMVDELAREKEMPREVLMRKVRTYAKEIVPAFNAIIYFKAAYWVAKRLVHALYRVRLGFADDKALAELDENSSVVFVMNHRSNMDYILATYLAAERTALSYAVGEGGVPQAIFPEGKLSRTGELGPPKLGLLGYLVRGFDPNTARDIVFVPVGINYDRVLEDRTLLRHAQNLPHRHSGYTVFKSLSFLGKNLSQALLGKRYRYGYACVNFGEPLSLKKWITLQHQNTNPLPLLHDAKPLADALMDSIGQITPILPVALVATVFNDNHNTTLSELALKSKVFELLESLEAAGYRAYIPRSDVDYAVSVGVRMFTLRKVLLEQDGGLQVNTDEIPLLQYYSNSIQHLLQREAAVTTTSHSNNTD